MKRIQVQVTDDIKERAEAVLEKEGLDISSLLKIVITKTANEQRIPIIFNGYENTKAMNIKENKSEIVEFEEDTAIKEEEIEEKELKPHVNVQNNPFANLAK
ncbi:type II toxin-antitoxin system RelB/DinJ family antitoxin [Lactococcus lactis]|uniref:type II toxin-antitoxin system RelB/DinJ family antitoxin n=1 Tax=Lactococcus lactis TaxID=1358 RepID=UPI0024A8EED9|nr:type II toxin-antitoxin system RelB/DinJ family antitoxin [Lactococcus lactis]